MHPFYSAGMFEVLAYVFENYTDVGSAWPLTALQNRLFGLGFDRRSVERAVRWLEGLKAAAEGWLREQGQSEARAAPPQSSTRVLAPWEQKRLGQDNWAYLCFLQSIDALSCATLELVLDRVAATPMAVVTREDLKLIVLMAYWSLDERPSILVVDELCQHRRLMQ